MRTTPRISKEEARAFVERWRLVNERQRRELLAMTPEEKFRQLATLMASAHRFGLREEDDPETLEVRRRWSRLRSKYLERRDE